jgi:hypothetical protein
MLLGFRAETLLVDYLMP